MQKLFKLLIVPFLVLFLCVGTSIAYTIDDNTEVGVGLSSGNPLSSVAIYGSSTFGDRTDVLGVDEFDTYGIDVTFVGSSMTLDIYTAFDGTFVLNSDLTLILADLFLTDGTYSYAIDLNPSGAGVITYSGIFTSHYFIEKYEGWLYGEVLNTDASGTSFSPPVQAMTGNSVQNPNVTQNAFNDGTNDGYVYSLTVDWVSLGYDAGDTLDLFWGTALCANDIIRGDVTVPGAPVPEPATMLLLGTGLIGLAGFGRKKLFKK